MDAGGEGQHRWIREGAHVEQVLVHCQGSLRQTSDEERVPLDACHADALIRISHKHATD